MKSILLLFLTFVSLSLVYSQKIGNIDFDDIQKRCFGNNAESPYEELYKRLQHFDTTFTEQQYNDVYYGIVFTKEYNPYGVSDKHDQFFDLYKEKEYKKAIPVGLEILNENPVNLQMIFKVLVCYNQIGDKKEERKLAKTYFGLLDAIYSSGDARTKETAMVVAYVSDEYEILADMELISGDQYLAGECDVFPVKTKKRKDLDMHFNVHFPLENLKKQFKK